MLRCELCKVRQFDSESRIISLNGNLQIPTDAVLPADLTIVLFVLNQVAVTLITVARIL